MGNKWGIMGITKTQMGVGGASKMEFLSDCF